MAFKKVKNKCTSITTKVKKDFREVTKNGIVTNKEFWKLLKPFLTSKAKGSFSKDQINIEIDGKLVTDERVHIEVFHQHYINIVEKPLVSSLGDSSNPSQYQNTEEKVIEKYSHHSSVRAIKNSVTFNKKFDLPYATTQETDKATGPDEISAKFVKLFANIISLIKILLQIIIVKSQNLPMWYQFSKKIREQT